MSEKTPDGEVNPVVNEDEQPEKVQEGISPVLARLIEEVRNDKIEDPNAYNRMHNRHNRSR